MLTEIQGDLFAVPGPDALAHGVNCQGVMGAGIAVEFKRRWPVMFHRYYVACANGSLVAGTALACPETSPRWIYCMATQAIPGPFARDEYIMPALGGVVEHAQRNGVKRIGMPRIGCGLGGLSWDDVRPLVERAAKDVDIVVVEWAKSATPMKGATS